MAQQVIGVGAAANDGTGDPLRTAFTKINANTAELYGLVGSASLTAATLGIYLSTMTSGGSGTANATAMRNDIVAANGKLIIVPPFTYTLAPVTINGPDAGATVYANGVVNIKFMPGHQFIPDGSLHAYDTAANNNGRMFRFYSCNTRLYGLNVDGQHLMEDCLRADFGEFRAYDTTMTRMGFTDLAYPGSTSFVHGTMGMLGKTCDHFEIIGYKGSDFIGKADGSYGNNPGKVNHIMPYECFDVVIRDVTISGGDGEDNDFFHVLDLRTPVQMRCEFENFNLYINHNTRRAIKNQGGFHTGKHIYVHQGSDFVPVAPGDAYIRVTGVTKANPGVVTMNLAASTVNIVAGQAVRFANIPGMTELNGNTYTVGTVVGSTFELSGTDTSGFTTYTAAAFGEVRRLYLVSSAPGSITNANPGVVTLDANHSLVNGALVTFSGVGGMTQLNGNTYMVGGMTAASGVATFNLMTTAGLSLDTSAFGVWTTGGELLRVTETGLKNLNCIDWAGNIDGYFRLTDSRIDARSFAFGLSHSSPSGTLGRMIGDNVEILSSNLRTLRHFDEGHVYNDVQGAPVFFGVAGAGCEIRRSNLSGGIFSIVTQGPYEIIEQNILDNPTEGFSNLGTGAAKDQLSFTRNRCITRTPGYLAVSRCARIQNVTNMVVDANIFEALGNTTYNTTFIEATNASGTGWARDNIAQVAGMIAFKTSAPGIVTKGPGFGYGPGNGGAVTQATDKTTGATLNRPSGQVTMNAAALAANTTVTFTLTNSYFKAGDILVFNHLSGGTFGAYKFDAQSAAGSALIAVRNLTAGSLSEAVKFSYSIIDSVAA